MWFEKAVKEKEKAGGWEAEQLWYNLETLTWWAGNNILSGLTSFWVQEASSPTAFEVYPKHTAVQHSLGMFGPHKHHLKQNLQQPFSQPMLNTLLVPEWSRCSVPCGIFHTEAGRSHLVTPGTLPFGVSSSPTWEMEMDHFQWEPFKSFKIQDVWEVKQASLFIEISLGPQFFVLGSAHFRKRLPPILLPCQQSH